MTGRTRIVGLAAALALTAPAAAGAQASVGTAGGAPSATIPVVERFDPATGARTRLTAADLSAPEIVAVQAALSRAGHGSGVRSGRLDAATRSALRSFQRSRGLAPCGCPSYATVVALGLEPRVVETVVGAGAARGGGRAPAFAHATSGGPDRVGSAAGAPGVRVATEEGVVVVRGSGSAAEVGGGAAGPGGASGAGSPAAGAAGPGASRGAAGSGAPGAAGSGATAAASGAWPASYVPGSYLPASAFGVFLFGGARGPRGHREARGERGRHGFHREPFGGPGGAPAPRPPIPYAPRLPEPRPAGPGGG